MVPNIIIGGLVTRKNSFRSNHTFNPSYYTLIPVSSIEKWVDNFWSQEKKNMKFS